MSLSRSFFLVTVLYGVLPVASTTGAALLTVTGTAPTQVQRIEQLISSLAGLKNAKFIRNGSMHDVTEAVSHMRRKWRWKRSQIKTAEDFIRIVGTGSSMTGKPYQIEFEDGRRMNSADWFRRQLKKLSR